MRHLSSEELVDVADGTRPQSELAHLSSCGPCRQQVAELRELMAVAARADVPEPSPLFWDHLSARVRDAVAQEGFTAESAGSAGWVPLWASWRVGIVAAALGAVLVVVALMPRTGPTTGRAGDEGRGSETVVESTLPVDVPVALADDPPLDLIVQLAGDLDWDSVVEAGLATGAGSADRAIGELSEGERSELQRLLREELSRLGA